MKFLLNIDVASNAEVDRIPVAIAAGAMLVKPPYRTDYDWHQAMPLDPEENVFRNNNMLS